VKKLFSTFLAVAVAFALSMVGVVFAANPVWVPVPAAPPMAEEQAAPAAEKKAAPAGEEKASKPKSLKVTGTIESLDVAAGIFKVKGKKGSVSLMAGKKVKLSSLQVGDKVTVKYSNGVASSVTAEKSKSKKSTKKAAAAPAPTAVPPPKAVPPPAAAPLPKAAPPPAAAPAPAAAPPPKTVPDPTIFPNVEKKPAEKL